MEAAAGVALRNGRYTQAASLYRKAVRLAYERDEVTRALDAQFDAAVSLVRLNKVDEAAALVESALAELSRTGMPAPAELHLLQATVLYRQGHCTRALTATESVISQAPGADAALRARFVRGLVAVAHPDVASLQAAQATPIRSPNPKNLGSKPIMKN